MGFVKVVKTREYFRRFKVKFRRRRECKTDYYARKRLVWMDKNKYAAPKYRLVVRFSNRDVICAIVASDITGDRVIKAAYGHELTKFGLKFGFKSWPAVYATGLLLARRVNVALGLPYLGSTEGVSQYYNISEGCDDESGVDVQTRRPFKAILDVGLYRTTTGSKLFAAVKGACDGGINIPHSPRRYPGTPPGKEEETDFEVTRKYIFGGHIAEYMNMLAEEDPELFNSKFSVAAANGISGDDIEGIWENIHKAIRDATPEQLNEKDLSKCGYFNTRKTPKDPSFKNFKMHHRPKRLTVQERKAKILEKIQMCEKHLGGKRTELLALVSSSAQ
uniref:60S ribosomal protein L5 n=1 Tax=Lygus hesperus TaxID=30085 RepID=A0A0A9WD73_LYGHE